MITLPCPLRVHCSEPMGNALPMKVATHDIIMQRANGVWGPLDPNWFQLHVENWWMPDKSERARTLLVVNLELKRNPRECHAFLARCEAIGFEQIAWYVWYENALQAAFLRPHWNKVLAYDRNLAVYMGIHLREEDYDPAIHAWCKYAANFNRRWIASTMPWTDLPWRTWPADAAFEHERTPEGVTRDLHIAMGYGGLPAIYLPNSGKDTYSDWSTFCAKWLAIASSAAQGTFTQQSRQEGSSSEQPSDT